MRTLRGHITAITSYIGFVWTFLFLIALSGNLLGIIKPPFITALYSTWLNNISSSLLFWWMTAIIGWVASVWAIKLVWKYRAEKPMRVFEDDFGTVDIAPDALKGLASAEIQSESGRKPSRVEFTHWRGVPSLKIWCDLTRTPAGQSPVEWGNSLKSSIERRIKNELHIDNKIRVEIIHQPFARPRTYSKTTSAA